MQLPQQDIQKIQRFFSNKPVKKVYLFGSFARGEANANSDIDLLIDWDYSQHIGLNYVAWLMDIQDLLKKDVDFVSWDYISPLIADKILSDKVLIYETTCNKGFNPAQKRNYQN